MQQCFRRRRRSVLVLALAAALAACSSGGTDDSGDSGRGTTGSYTISQGDEYVALGDSYTAAPQTGGGDVPDGCYRSLVNYPHRIAEATGAQLFDNSCTGASTRSLTEPQRTYFGVHPPQLAHVNADTDLVTIRIGVNDYGMFGRIMKCARTFGPDMHGTPCADADGITGPTGIDTRLHEMQDSLVVGLQEIRRRAPDARVLVIGYPQIVPSHGTCALLPLPRGDYAYARHVFDGFNAALKSAAEQTDLTYVDVAAASRGHDICSDEPWVAGFRSAYSGAPPWHPYPQESEAVARLVLDELRQDD